MYLMRPALTTPSLTSSPLVVVCNKPLNPVGAAHILNHWIVTDLPVAKSLRKTDYSRHPSAVYSSAAGAWYSESPFILKCRLACSSAGFALWAPKGSGPVVSGRHCFGLVPHPSTQTSGASFFFPLFENGPWAIGDVCDIEIRFVDEHSTDTYSLHWAVGSLGWLCCPLKKSGRLSDQEFYFPPWSGNGYPSATWSAAKFCGCPASGSRWHGLNDLDIVVKLTRGNLKETREECQDCTSRHYSLPS